MGVAAARRQQVGIVRTHEPVLVRTCVQQLIGQPHLILLFPQPPTLHPLLVCSPVALACPLPLRPCLLWGEQGMEIGGARGEERSSGGFSGCGCGCG